MKENTRLVTSVINEITQSNKFSPVESESTGLSPDLSDKDIEETIERLSKLERYAKNGVSFNKIEMQNNTK